MAPPLDVNKRALISYRFMSARTATVSMAIALCKCWRREPPGAVCDGAVSSRPRDVLRGQGRSYVPVSTPRESTWPAIRFSSALVVVTRSETGSSMANTWK